MSTSLDESEIDYDITSKKKEEFNHSYAIQSAALHIVTHSNKLFIDQREGIQKMLKSGWMGCANNQHSTMNK